MGLKTFFQRWSNRSKRKDLLSQIDVMLDQLKTFTIPSVKLAAEQFKKTHYRTQAGQSFVTAFKKTKLSGDLLDTTLKVLENAAELGEYLIGVVEKDFPEDMTVQGWTLYTNNVAEVIEVIQFVQDYATSLANYLVTAEINLERKQDEQTGITNYTVSLLERDKYAFMDCLKVLSEDRHTIQQKLESIPKVTITPENADAIVETVGVSKSDPLKMNFFSPRTNPAMIVGSMIVKYQAAKYHRAQADWRLVQCRILKLKQLKEGREDAKIDSQIEYYVNISDKLKAEIDQMEEEYGIN